MHGPPLSDSEIEQLVARRLADREARERELTDGETYVAVYEVRHYFRKLPNGNGSADERALREVRDTTLMERSVQETYEQAGYDIDGLVIIPRKLTRITGSGVDVPLDAHERVT